MRRAPNSLKKAYMNDVMIDCETLGTTADAVIMSIGAVKFNLTTAEIDDDAFYASISVDSNLALGRRITESTLQFWMAQSKEAQGVFNEAKTTLEESLSTFSEWLGHNKRCVWSKGADFDLPMIAHAYTQLDMEIPWLFWNSRCARTYLKLPCAGRVPAPDNTLKHNALADAIAQAKHVQAVHAYMVSMRPGVAA